MYISSLVKKLLNYENGTLLEVTWEDRTNYFYTLETFYDSDNGLEMEDPEYKEYHAALLRLHESKDNKSFPKQVSEFEEIGDDKNNPFMIKKAQTGETIWKSSMK